MIYTVYILYSESCNKFYVGHTNDLLRRLKEHNNNKKGYTIRCRPWKLVYSENSQDRPQAVRLEKYLKKFKNKERVRHYIYGWRSSKSPR